MTAAAKCAPAVRPSATPNSTILGRHLRGGAYSVCATPMAVYTIPNNPQAARISALTVLLTCTMNGDVQYKPSATYPPALLYSRRETHHSAPPSHRPKMTRGRLRNSRVIRIATSVGVGIH